MPATSVTTSSYPSLNVQVHAPRLSLLGATDEFLVRLVPVVRKGVVTAAHTPRNHAHSRSGLSLYKDKSSNGHEADPAKVSDSFWRLYFFEPNLAGPGLPAQRCRLIHEPRRSGRDQQVWGLAREQWSTGRREDIELTGVAECLPVLGIRDLRDR